MSLYHDTRLQDLAKIAAEGAGKNTGVAPQLLFANIMFMLVDAVEDGRLLLPPNQTPKMTWDEVWKHFDETGAESYPQLNEVKNERCN